MDQQYMNKKKEESMESVLQQIGEFGRFQKILVTMFIIICFPTTYQVLIMYFSTITPTWKCIANSSSCSLNGTLSPDNKYRCAIQRSEWYYTEVDRFSIVTQFDIHCDKEWQINLVSCMIFIGWAVGGVILGWTGDRFGRRSVLVPSFCTMLAAGFITPFLPNIYLIMLCQLVIGFCIPGVQLQAFILISEFVGSKHRPFASFLLVIFNPVGWCILALKAYLIMNWKTLSIVCTAPYIICIFFSKFIPESIKWLHFHGKTDEVTKIVQRIAKWNNAKIESNIMIAAPTTIIYKSNPFDLFRGYPMAKSSLIQGFLWYATVTCYFGLHMAANDLGGSVYRDFALLNLCETPGLALAPFLCTRFGRKRSTLIPLSIGCTACLIISALQTVEGMRIARTVIGILGDIAMSMSFFGIYQWSVEIYPLRIRNQGMGFLQVVSHGGSVVVPWIVKGLKPVGKWCPFLVLGVTTLIACVTSLKLPETKTMDKVENKNESYQQAECTVVENPNCDYESINFQ